MTVENSDWSPTNIQKAVIMSQGTPEQQEAARKFFKEHLAYKTIGVAPIPSLEQVSKDIVVTSHVISGPINPWQALTLESSKYNNIIVISPDVDKVMEGINAHLRLAIAVCRVSLPTLGEVNRWTQERPEQMVKYSLLHFGHNLGQVLSEMEILLNNLLQNHKPENVLVSTVTL